MYKKIKNGSFMNLFWFIICMLPLIFILIYAIQFFNTKKYEYNVINNNVNIDNSVVSNGINVVNNYFVIDNIDNFTIAFKFNSNSKYNYLYFSDLSYSNYGLLSLNGYQKDLTSSNFNENIYYFDYDFLVDDTIYILNGSTHNFTNLKIMFFSSNTQLDEKTFMNFDNYKNQTLTTINYNLDLESFLSSIYNSFTSNGFINNTLIQVVNYFNVNNVFMNLAILYIEYFIIIQLLHLFVDFMLLIPNICHKFMEKIGGERD